MIYTLYTGATLRYGADVVYRGIDVTVGVWFCDLFWDLDILSSLGTTKNPLPWMAGETPITPWTACLGWFCTLSVVYAGLLRIS